MASQMENPALSTRGVPVTVQADSTNSPEYALETLRAQYLAEVFALSPDTACTIAELAFGGGAHE